jgi:hypothetical protein
LPHHHHDPPVEDVQLLGQLGEQRLQAGPLVDVAISSPVAHLIEVSDPFQPPLHLADGIWGAGDLVLGQPLGNDVAEQGRTEGIEHGEQRLGPRSERILARQLRAGLGTIVAAAVVGLVSHRVAVHPSVALDAAKQPLEDVVARFARRLPTTPAAVPPLPLLLDTSPRLLVDEGWPGRVQQRTLPRGPVPVGLPDVGHVAEQLNYGVSARKLALKRGSNTSAFEEYANPSWGAPAGDAVDLRGTIATARFQLDLGSDRAESIV